MRGVLRCVLHLLALYLRMDQPAPCAHVFYCSSLSPMLLFAPSLSHHTVICHPTSLLDFTLLFLKLALLLYSTPTFFPYVFFPRAVQLIYLEICSSCFLFLCVSHLCSLAVGTQCSLPPLPGLWCLGGQLWKVLSTLSSRYKYAESLVE